MNENRSPVDQVPLEFGELIAEARRLQILEEIERHLRREGRKKMRRNDPCPCGSGRKFKHCCLPSVKRNH